MTKSTITDKRVTSVIERLEHYACNLKWTNVRGAQDLLAAADGLRELQERRKADSEPVGTLSVRAMSYNGKKIGTQFGFVHSDAAMTIAEGDYPLYRHAQPAPEYPETLPCPVLLEPGLRFGKGVTTSMVLKALQRRADYYAELDAMTPEQRAEHDAGIEEFKKMLPQPAPAVEDETKGEWRRLALQFDGHRMQAISFLKMILNELPATEFSSAREFIKAGPLPGEEILRNRIAEIAALSQPAPVVPEKCPAEIRDLISSHTDALFNDDDAQEIWNACRSAMLQASPVCTCPSGDGSLRWPCPVHPGNSPAISDSARDALEKALAAMEFMGDTLNNLDAVCTEDVELVAPAFDAVRNVLAAAQQEVKGE